MTRAGSRRPMIGPSQPGAANGATERTRSMAEKQLVISIFDDEATAHAAAVAVKETGAAVDDAIGVLVLDQKGELKTHKLGTTSGGKGAAAGAVLSLLGPI